MQLLERMSGNPELAMRMAAAENAVVSGKRSASRAAAELLADFNF